MKFVYSLIFALALLVTGCVHLPSVQSPYCPVPGPSNPGVTIPGSILHPSSAGSAKAAIQSTLNWFAVITIIAGLVSVGLGAFSIYRGCVVSGIKFILGGLLLPVAGIYVAYHWILIVSLTLLALAVYLTVTYWKNVTPFLGAVGADVNPLFVKLGVVKAPPKPIILASSVPAPASTTK